MIEKSRKDIVDKIIESEIQKTGENIVASTPDYPEIKASAEEIQKEFQEILKKSEAYENAVKGQISFVEEERSGGSKRFSSFAKAAVIFLVAGACLFGLSMKSEATRMWWLKSAEKIVGEDRREAVNNDENRVISATSEDDAIEEILKETGIQMPVMLYKPEGMVFDGYDYDEKVDQGAMYYTYGEYIISVYGYSPDKNASYYKIQDGEIIFEENIETSYGIVRIIELLANEDEEIGVSAEWTYNNYQYQIIGKVTSSEVKKIIENILYK